MKDMKIKNLECYEGMLIVVDMVNGFAKYGALADPKIGEIVPRQIELIKKAKAEGKLIVFIKDAHTMDSVEHDRFEKPHSVKGSGEEELIDELKSYEDYGISIEKNSTSFMEAPDFRELIRKVPNLKTVDIVGCCTDICVNNGALGLANYFDQWNKRVLIQVHKDAIATFAEEARGEYVNAALLLMAQQGIKLVGERQFVKKR